MNMKLSKYLMPMLFLLLASCGGQNTSVGTGSHATPTADTQANTVKIDRSVTKVNLLDSLAALYPNGKATAAQKAKSTQYFAQNPAALTMTAPATTASMKSQSAKAQPMAVAADYQPVARIQNTTLEGSYFFSIYDAEIENALNTNPDWILEGAAFWASLATGDGLSPVHRFRNLQNGSYLYTIYEAEKASIISNFLSTFTYEGVSWYARQTQATGWTPLYRFRNLINGTYLFTADENEKMLIQIWYEDIFSLEGVAYYVRDRVLPADPVVVSIAPLAATLGVATVFVVEGVNLPLDAELVFSGAACSAPLERSSTGFRQTCRPAGTVGVNNLSVKASNTIGANPIIGAKPITLLAPTVEPEYTGTLTDTGITNMQCYSVGSDALISCTSEAAIALNPKQDGMIGRDVTAPATTDGKLGFSYSDAPKAAGGVYDRTECVKDNVTGLMWEGKTTTGVRNHLDGYTNYDDPTVAQKWDGIQNRLVNATQAEIDAMTNTIGYKNYVNGIALCGYSDWRVPNMSELGGLASVGAFNVVDTVWFPNNWGATLWSSTNDENPLVNSSQTWLVEHTGESRPSSRDVTYNVRLVRGGTTLAVNRYSYLNNGTEVLDAKTKLIWRRCAEEMAWNGRTCVGVALRSSHEQALRHANTQTGWRLPNKKELESLYTSGLSAALDASVFPPTNFEDITFSTSTPDVDYPYQVWGPFSKGYRSAEAWPVRLVRNSP